VKLLHQDWRNISLLWSYDIKIQVSDQEKTARLFFLTEYLKQYNYCEAMISRFKEQMIQDYNEIRSRESFLFFVFYLKQFNLLWSYEIQDKENTQDYNETMSTVKLKIQDTKRFNAIALTIAKL